MPLPSVPSLARHVFGALVRLGAAVSLLSLLSLLPWHPFPLLEHFRLHLLAGSAFVALIAALARRGGSFDVAAACALVNLVLVTPALSGTSRPGPSDGVKVRLLLSNVLTSNRDSAALARAIRELEPDVVALVEPDRRWFAALAPALAEYRARREVSTGGNFGIAVYSRGAMSVSVENLGSTLPTLVARVSLPPSSAGVGAVPFDFVLTHPIPPMTAATAASHRRQLEAVAARVNSLAGPVVVAGDFNATPWSRSFARFLSATGLHDSRDGFGVQATFPTFQAWPMRLPIDHVLVSPSIGVHTRRVERNVGSDHFPVFVELNLPRRR